MMCPLFYIKNTIITGNEIVTNDEILTILDLKNENTNLYAFNSFSGETSLLENPYIESVDFTRSFPDTLKIDITERKIRGYIPYMNSFLYIDGDGRILDVQSSYTTPLPIVNGLTFKEFTLGEKLKVSNKEKLDIVVELSKLMTKYELLDDVIKVDVSKPEDIHIYVNKIDVIFGSFTDYNWKISTLNEILKNLSPEDKGILDISSSDKIPLFTYLT